MRRWLLPAAFLVAAALTAEHMARELFHALDHPSARAVLVGVYYALRTAVSLAFAVFTIGRVEPRRHARDPLALCACAVAMATVLAFAPPGSGAATGLVLAGDVVAVLGCMWLLYAALGLGRCFGVLPEARGLVTRGPYRLVRHPLYLGELTACAGLALAAPSALNGALLCVFAVAQAVRMRFEERELTLAFPAYAEYAASTPGLIPRLLPAAAWQRRRPAPARVPANS